jgi:WhiB family redox-sensing transcriptional regulator
VDGRGIDHVDELLGLNQQWRDAAACSRFPVELFFPLVEGEAVEAKSICNSCEVRSKCLEFAIAAGERFGVWGGLTSQERRSLVARRTRAAAARRPAPTV